MDNISSKFKISDITKISDFIDKKIDTLPESDLCIQNADYLIQFKYLDEEKTEVINPGCFIMSRISSGVKLDKFTLREYNLLETIDNTQIILKEAEKFFTRLEVYKKRKKCKRGVLLYSNPGQGKTASINEACKRYLKEEGTVVIIWNTDSLESSYVSDFFIKKSSFNESVKKLIIVIEDIGGGSVDNCDNGPRVVDSSLLNFLDGMGDPFKGVPTFIVATTNNPQTTVEALIDRPGRFDKVIELKAPNIEQCQEILCFLMDKKELTVDEIAASTLAAKESFSIVHLEEVVVRSDLDEISILDAVKELIAHKKRFKEAFAKESRKSLGI